MCAAVGVAVPRVSTPEDSGTDAPSRLREPDPEDSVPPCQAWSANGSLEGQELMAKREVLKRDGGGTGKEGA